MAEVSPGLYPFASHFVELGKHRCHYLDEGAGPLVLMVHGNPTWSFYYRRLVESLRPQYRCVVPDHIGMGFSDKPSDADYGYTLAQRVDDLELFMDKVAPTGMVHLVVHDWGGMIGLAWAQRYPERVASLVLLNTAAFHLPASKPFPWQLALGRNSKVGAWLIRGFNAFARTATRVACTRVRLSKAVRDAYCAPYDSWDHRIATLRFVQDIPLNPGDRGFDLVTRVQESLPNFANKPVLICWGLKDFVFDVHFLKEWERVFPSASVHRFDDCGHYILEDAFDDIDPLVHTFLKAVPA